MLLRIVAIVAVLIGILVVLPVACVPSELETRYDPDADAGSDADAEMDAANDGPPACDMATLSPPPSLGDGTSIAPFIVAVRSVYVGDGAKPLPGYDLDHLCTCEAKDGDSCKPADSEPKCDDPRGIDNSGASLFSFLQQAVGSAYFGSEALSASAEVGEWGLLLRIWSYTGDANDPTVGVSVYSSAGFDPGTVPTWDGNDVWPVSESSVVAGGGVGEPLFYAKSAYVKDGVLVASLPVLPLPLGGDASSLTVRIQGVLLTAKLVFDGSGGVQLTEGVIAGRWSEADLFAGLSSFVGPSGSKICNDASVEYSLAKVELCGSRDILVDPAQPASSPCDAISIGIGFEAWPAILGDVVADPVPPPGCPPETDPAFDSCE